jgi:hypothetical protein
VSLQRCNIQSVRCQNCAGNCFISQMFVNHRYRSKPDNGGKYERRFQPHMRGGAFQAITILQLIMRDNTSSPFRSVGRCYLRLFKKVYIFFSQVTFLYILQVKGKCEDLGPKKSVRMEV